MKSLLPLPPVATKTAISYREEEVILSVLCEEKRRSVVRNVRRMLFTMENLKALWEKSSQFPTLFNEEINNDFQKFLEVFLVQNGNSITTNGLFWVVDDFVGVYYLTHIVPDVSAQVHYSFFDRCQNGREELTKKMISYVFDRYKFNRMAVQVPCYAHDSTFNFVNRLGFNYEGRLKKACKFKGDWFDVKLFGLLREDHFKNGNAD